MTNNNTIAGSNEHLLAFAARGFIDGLSEAQQSAFLQLFPSDQGDTKALAAAIEHAEFQRRRGVDFVIDEALLAAVDYALSRQSSAVSTVCSQIEAHWSELSQETQTEIQERIYKAGINGMNDMSKMSMDAVLWMNIASFPLTRTENVPGV